MEEIRAALAPGTSVEVWFQDEMRVGQKNKLTYRWARKVHAPVPPTIKGPNRPTCSVRSAPNAEPAPHLVLPACNTEAMQLHLDEIATKITPGAHAILLLDQAGWHGAKDLKVPSNILQVPPRAPKLNSQENPGSSCGRTGCHIVSSNPFEISSSDTRIFAERVRIPKIRTPR